MTCQASACLPNAFCHDTVCAACALLPPLAQPPHHTQGGSCCCHLTASCRCICHASSSGRSAIQPLLAYWSRSCCF
jgi:hypothetical protein